MRDGKTPSNVGTWDMTDTLIVFFLAGVNRSENAAQSVCACVGICNAVMQVLARLLFCGSRLACDSGDAVYQLPRVDAIASRPAPTEYCTLSCLFTPRPQPAQQAGQAADNQAADMGRVGNLAKADH